MSKGGGNATKGVKTRIRGGNERKCEKGGRDNTRKRGNTKNRVKYEGGGICTTLDAVLAVGTHVCGAQQ